MQASLTSLCKCSLEDLVAQSIYLDIHLCGSDTIGGTCYLEVHIPKVVFVPKDIGEDSVVRPLILGDKSHRNP